MTQMLTSDLFAVANLVQGRKPGTKCGGRPVQGVWGTEVPKWGPGAKPR